MNAEAIVAVVQVKESNIFTQQKRLWVDVSTRQYHGWIEHAWEGWDYYGEAGDGYATSRY